jgi:hypothetical protein
MKRPLLIVILFLASAVTAAAATPADYRQRVESALTDANELLANIDSGDAAYERQQIQRIRREIPASERIEWPTGSVETQNPWLHQALDDLAQSTDPAARKRTITGISQRLDALALSIAELESAARTGPSKDADKQKLGEILRRPEYQPAKAEEESLFQKVWREFWKWLEDSFPRPNIMHQDQVGLGSLRLIIQIVVIAAVVAIVGFLFWRFLPYFSARFGKRGDARDKGRVILGEAIGDDVSAADILGEAEQLARSGDIRSAIRKGYIAALCELSDRRVLRLARHKTNRDYLADVRRNTGVYEGLGRLTYSYESNWYGLRTAAPEDWQAFRDRYEETLREARS